MDFSRKLDRLQEIKSAIEKEIALLHLLVTDILGDNINDFINISALARAGSFFEVNDALTVAQTYRSVPKMKIQIHAQTIINLVQHYEAEKSFKTEKCLLGRDGDVDDGNVDGGGGDGGDGARRDGADPPGVIARDYDSDLESVD